MPLSADSSAYANKSDLTQISAEKKAVKIVIISATSTATSATHTKKEKIAQKSVLRDLCGSIAVWSF